jgi:hypothetical protein
MDVQQNEEHAGSAPETTRQKAMWLRGEAALAEWKKRDTERDRRRAVEARRRTVEARRLSARAQLGQVARRERLDAQEWRRKPWLRPWRIVGVTFAASCVGSDGAKRRSDGAKRRSEGAKRRSEGAKRRSDGVRQRGGWPQRGPVGSHLALALDWPLGRAHA